MRKKKNTDEERAAAHQWLAAVSAELGQDPELIRSLIGELLDLTRQVAHGPSRPAAPLTAFLVGVAAGAGDDADAVATVARAREKIADIAQLLARRAVVERGEES